MEIVALLDELVNGLVDAGPRKLTVGFERANYPLIGFDVQTFIHYTFTTHLMQTTNKEALLTQAFDLKWVIIDGLTILNRLSYYPICLDMLVNPTATCGALCAGLTNISRQKIL